MGSQMWRCLEGPRNEFTFNVDLNRLVDGPYEEACSCGRVGARMLWCKHVENVFKFSNADWRKFLKPWLRVESWQEQIGDDWDIPSAQDMVSSANTLHALDMLHTMKQPVISLRAAGRPKKDEHMSADQAERLKGFLENLRAQGQRQAHILEAAAGIALTKNPGGKNTKKRCSICKSENHRRTRCPLKDGHGAEDNAAAHTHDTPSENDSAQESHVDAPADCEASSDRAPKTNAEPAAADVAQQSADTKPTADDAQAADVATAGSAHASPTADDAQAADVATAGSAHASPTADDTQAADVAAAGSANEKIGRPASSKTTAHVEHNSDDPDDYVEFVKERCASRRRKTKTTAVVAPYGVYATKADALQELKELLGPPLEVLGDGRCWRYALLASLGVLQHATQKPHRLRAATRGDIAAADELLERMKFDAKNTPAFKSQLRKSRVLNLKARSWGGEVELSLAAFTLGVPVLRLKKELHQDVWTPPSFEVHDHISSTYFSCDSDMHEKNITVLQVIELLKDKSKPLLVIEHDGQAHFSAYAPPGFKFEMKQWLRNVLQDPKESQHREADEHVKQENTSKKAPPRAKSTRPIKKPKLSI